MNKDEILKRNIKDCKGNDEYLMKVKINAYKYSLFAILFVSVFFTIGLSNPELPTIMFLNISWEINEIVQLPIYIFFIVYYLYYYSVLKEKKDLYIAIFFITCISLILFSVVLVDLF